MTDQLNFHSYRRSQAATGAGGGAPRLTGKLPLTLAELGGGQQDTVTVDFLLMGPPDVSGLKPGAVRRTYPANGALNVDVDKCPYVEFAAEDIPWRYSPEPNHDRLGPWLLLVVGTGAELSLLGGSRVMLSQGLVAKYNAAQLASKAYQWAHVQDHDQARVSRLLSPLPLEAKRSYVAVLVPAYDPTTNQLHLPAGRAIRAYYAWHFTTASSDKSFVDLAKRLWPLKPVPNNLGMAPVAYQTGSHQTKIKPRMLVGGALVGLNVNTSPQLPPQIKSHFTPLRPRVDSAYDHDEAGRPLIHLPLYGAPWLNPGQDEPTWMSQLNDDPRLRGLAGLGMWAGIEWQERIVDAAASQLGTFYSAARRIRQLTTGLAAARFLWQRRLPAEENHRLQVLGPVLSRIAVPGGGSALNYVTNAGRPLPPAFFSSAARRLLRPGTARARLVQDHALDPPQLFTRMNTCPTEDRKPAPGLLHADHFCNGVLDEKIDSASSEAADFDITGVAFEEVWQFHDEEQQQWQEAGLNFDRTFEDVYKNLVKSPAYRQDLLRAAHNPLPVRPCEMPRQQVGLTDLSLQLHDALTPVGNNAFVIRRVLATISGLDDQPLTPPELCLDFHIPAWKFLNEFHQDWFLPGLGEMHHWTTDDNGQKIIDLEKDPVLAAKTNGRFTDAFLVGFNQQTLAELRWRNVPLAAGCTPLRRFWEPLRPEMPGQESEPGEDIVGIHRWSDNSPLGDAQHEADEAKGDNLVLIFKSLLWKRYPQTLIYLLPDQNDQPNWNAVHITPNLHVEIGRDVVAFGFSQTVDILDTHWVVIEQVPQDYTFYNQSKWPDLPLQPDDQDTSAQFAQTAFARPVRVLICGKELKPSN